jgi:sugar lactone lactonase YvrE
MKLLSIVLLMLSIVSAVSAQKLELLWKSDTLLRVPESVCFDERSGILYVSNIDGKSNEKDGKGFISKLGTDGKIKSLNWASGLNAPKGMGLFKNKLYVADLTRVVVIESSTGKITHSIEIDGAKFLNDITVAANGRIFVSDSETGKIFVISGHKASLYFEGKEFKRVNGLLALQQGLYVADAGTGINYRLGDDKKLVKFAETSQGADGIVKAGHDEYIVSSWSGEIYFVDAAGKSTKMLDTKTQKLNSADIDFDHQRKIVFVPTFFGNCVMAYQFTR